MPLPEQRLISVGRGVWYVDTEVLTLRPEAFVEKNASSESLIVRKDLLTQLVD